MNKKGILAKRAGIAALVAVMAASMSTTIVYADSTTTPDTTEISDTYVYDGPGDRPTENDRCSLKYYGVDKWKRSASDVKVMAYHIIDATYNEYGFTGWKELPSATSVVRLNSFSRPEDNVVQVVVEDEFKYLDADGNKTNDESKKVRSNPTYNNKKVITSEDVTTLARALMNPETNALFDKVELTWVDGENCYMTNDAKPGMYLVIVEKEDRGVIYNPVIISNDYADANIAQSLSNYIDADGRNASIHDSDAFTAKDFPYESGISLNNDAFVGYGTVNPTDVKSLVTNDNKDKAPQDQTDYMSSHQTVVYYKDTQKSGNVYTLYHDDTFDDESRIEVMALKGMAYAKKSSIPLEKNIVNASVPKTYASDVANDSKLGYSKFDDVSEGDTVMYDIFTQIPYYASGYFADEEKFLFKITDTQHEGLAAVAKDNIVVYTADSAQIDAQNIASEVKQTDNILEEGEDTYTITINDDNSFSVSFAKDYCLNNPGKMIIVSYTTTVTEDAAKGLNGNKNEVFLEYTTLPTNPDNEDNKPSRGYKFDFAIQYTFTPTAFKLAEDGSVVATGTTNLVTNEDEGDIAKGETAVNPLAGAKFKLQRVGTHYAPDNTVRITAIPQDRDTWKAETEALERDAKTSFNGYQTWFMTSDENGIIKFDSAKDGIDEGIYILKEVEAPKDYTINDTIYVIEVTPTFSDDQRFIGTDVKIGESNLDEDGNIIGYDIDGSTFVDGTNYEYDEYGKLLTEYKYSEYATGLTGSYDGNIDFLVSGSGYGEHNTIVNYVVNEDGTLGDEKVATTNLEGIVNTKLTRIPSTGSVGTIAYTVGGFAIMGVAVARVARKKKNRDSE